MKKKIIAVVAVVLILAIAVVGTYAYLTDTKSVTNTFTVGNIQITLDEKNTETNGSGVPVSPVVRSADGNMYKLIPGKSYTKDPIVHVVEKSEPCYVFVKIENDISTLIDMTALNAQISAKHWAPIAEGSNIYAYYQTVDASAAQQDLPVFESFAVLGTVTGAQLAALDANADITVTAYAVQAEGFDTASAAWAATFGA